MTFFPCAHWPLVYFLWRSVCSSLCLFFSWIICLLIVELWDSLHFLDASPYQIPITNIFLSFFFLSFFIIALLWRRLGFDGIWVSENSLKKVMHIYWFFFNTFCAFTFDTEITNSLGVNFSGDIELCPTPPFRIVSFPSVVCWQSCHYSFSGLCPSFEASGLCVSLCHRHAVPVTTTLSSTSGECGCPRCGIFQIIWIA